MVCIWCSTNKPIGFIPGIIISGIHIHTENMTPRGRNERHWFLMEKSKRLLMECGVLSRKGHLIGSVMNDRPGDAGNGRTMEKRRMERRRMPRKVRSPHNELLDS